MKVKVYSLKEILEKGLTIENNVIEDIKIIFSQQFNSVELRINFSNCSLGGYNSTFNVGYMFENVVKVLKRKEEYVSVEELNKIPVRAIMKSNGISVVGFGHFMNDEFILYEELVKMGLNNDGRYIHVIHAMLGYYGYSIIAYGK